MQQGASTCVPVNRYETAHRYRSCRDVAMLHRRTCESIGRHAFGVARITGFGSGGLLFAVASFYTSATGGDRAIL